MAFQLRKTWRPPLVWLPMILVNMKGGNGRNDDDDHDGSGDRTGENWQGTGESMVVNDWFYHPFRYPGNKFGRGSTIGDKPDNHPDSGDDVDTTNGITCLSGTEWLI